MAVGEIQHPFPGHFETVTIPTGATGLSGEVNLGGRSLVAIKMPVAWTAASLTFQACEVSGGTFNNVWDDVGSEYTVAAAVDRWIPLTPAAFVSIPFLKVRSGTSGTPVNQAADRVLTLILREIE